MSMKQVKCPDCDGTIDISDDVVEGEIITCHNCGLEFEYKNGELKELTIEGEDWGE